MLDNMKINHRFLLAITLILLVFGLAAHSLPAVSLCECVSASLDEASTSNLDLCLICQLQTGIHTTSYSASPNRDRIFHHHSQLILNPLEYVTPVLHPPTTF